MSDSGYQRMGIVAKRALDLARARDAHVRCPGCDVAIMPADLLAHVRDGRCTGRPPPHPSARWIPWADAERLGIASASLPRLVRDGFVRMRTVRRRRELLLRDVVIEVARALVSRPGGEGA